MKFSAWPETTLKFSQGKNETSRFGNLPGHSNVKLNAAKRPINLVRGR